MKRLAISLALAAMSLSCLASTQTVTKLVVWTKSGEKVAYTLDAESSVVFDDSAVQISGAQNSVSLPLSDLKTFTYEQTSFTGLENLESEGPKLTMADGSLLIFNLNPGVNTVEIANTAGQVVLSRRIDAAGEFAFPLSGLAKGVYIVKVNNSSYKILKK